LDKDERKNKSRIIETLIITVALLVGYRLEITSFTEVVLGLFVVSSVVYYLTMQLEIEGFGLKVMAYTTAGLFSFSIVSYFSLLADAFEAIRVWYIASIIWLLTYANLAPKSGMESLRNYSDDLIEKLELKEESFKKNLKSKEGFKASLRVFFQPVMPAKLAEYYMRYFEWVLIITGIFYSIWVILAKQKVISLPIIWLIIIVSVLIVSFIRNNRGKLLEIHTVTRDVLEGIISYLKSFFIDNK